ncbi:NAD(P)/FAD-dependent oxidoreductase [Pseudomonas putida]
MKLQAAVPGASRADWSWWREDVEQAHGPAQAALNGEVALDVAVVGGGFAGLWTAIALKARAPQLRVGLLEASRVGDGASSRNGGIVHGYWQSLPANIRAFGVDTALELARLGSEAQLAFKAFVSAPGRDVWWKEEGNLRVATCPAQEAALRKFLDGCAGLGVENYVQPLSAPQVRELVASPVFGSGIYFPEAGNVHPGRLVLALKKAALEAGVVIYEHSPVSRIDEGQPHRVVTNTGTVSARHVVLATNVGLAGLPGVGSRVSLFSSYATMSNRNEQALQQLGWSKAMGMNDARMFLHYFRQTRDGRVLMGSGSGPIGWGSAASAEALRHDSASLERPRAGLQRLLPGVARAGFARSWGWPIDVSADRVPFFKTCKPGIHYAAGFSGHGVQAGWIAGQCLSSLVLEQKDKWYHSPFCQRRVPRLPPEPFKYAGACAIRAAILACEEAEQADRRASYTAQTVAALPALLGLRIGVR